MKYSRKIKSFASLELIYDFFELVFTQREILYTAALPYTG